MKLALLTVHTDVLRKMLQFPENSEILRIEVLHDRNGILEILLGNVGWETMEGEVIRRAPLGTITDSKINWNLPEDNNEDNQQ